jgi:flagellar biosynthesis/type III secretory pathway M-ring protein FliF/YscJ
VVVNYKTLADGKPLPLTEQMKQIEDLTREAMGYSEKRGDTLNVVNSPFNAVDDEVVNCRSGNSRLYRSADVRRSLAAGADCRVAAVA